MMIRQSMSTGHGDTLEDLVKELEPQIEGMRAKQAQMEAYIHMAHQRDSDEIERLREFCTHAGILKAQEEHNKLRAEQKTLRNAAVTATERAEKAEAERDALREDAERWRTLPMFIDDYQINYVRLKEEIDAARREA